MTEISQTKYVKLDDGVSFSLVRTNPKLTTNTKLMYNGKKMYMESYASSELMNRAQYKNVSIKQNSTYNKDIASFLTGSGSQAYNVYQNFSNIAISDSFDNQFETLYWCGAEYIESSFYEEEIGFVAPLYLREKMPNYFLIFRLDTPSNYNFTIDKVTKEVKDKTFDFKEDILDKAVLIKTFDLREGSVLGNYIHNYVEQEGFEFDKSMYVNFSTSEVTYYGINKLDGVLEKRVENFEDELLRCDNPVMANDKWFTEGFERNGLIFPYIMNIEYLFNDDNFKNVNGEESYDFARYIGVYCNNIEFGEFTDFKELKELFNSDSELFNSEYTNDNVIYYFEDNKKNLHRFTNTESDGLKIDGKSYELFDENLISGFEKSRITAYAEPLDIYEGFINRAQYGFEILKPLEPGDWIGIEYNGYAECYFADNKNVSNGVKSDMLIGEYGEYRFSVNEKSSINDIAEALVKSVNNNKNSKFEAKCFNNTVVFYAKLEGEEYNKAKVLIESSLLYNEKISISISNNIKYINIKTVEDITYDNLPIEHIDQYIDDSDDVMPVKFDMEGNEISVELSSFGNYYTDCFNGACVADIDPRTNTYKNIFKIYAEEEVFFCLDRCLKTNNGMGRKICTNMIYINAEGKTDSTYRIVIVEDAPRDKQGISAYDVSVSSTCQVEIIDVFKPNFGVLSWFPVKDFDFDINYSSYGQYGAFVDECEELSKKVTYSNINENDSGGGENISINVETTYMDEIKDLAKSPFYDEYGDSLYTEYDYYNEHILPDLCLISKSAPFISKWGYYDEQKDSCENPYRLNVNKAFGVSNLSANTFLRNCDENEYTHSMPYYMTLDTEIDYYKNYQYIASDKVYNNHYVKKDDGDSDSDSDSDGNLQTFDTFLDCENYWVNMFMKTDEDMFSYFFSGKKYGKRFDRKYSRFLGGDKFHNPSTLFRGVKFEVIQQYNGVEKISNEYNNYKFSFVYIPVMINTNTFSFKVHFVKNDTFKFIVGIMFVNTMLGIYKHNIFNGNVDYFSKGFLYAAGKDIIRPDISDKYYYNLHIYDDEDSDGYDSDDDSDDKIISFINTDKKFWKGKINSTKTPCYYMWKCDFIDEEIMYITTGNQNVSIDNIIGEFKLIYNDDNTTINFVKSFDTIKSYENSFTKLDFVNRKIEWEREYVEYDTIIYGCSKFEYYGFLICEAALPQLERTGYILKDVCVIPYTYRKGTTGYKIDVKNLTFRLESLRDILMNVENKYSVREIRFYNTDIEKGSVNFTFSNDYDPNGVKQIEVNISDGSISIDGNSNSDSNSGDDDDDKSIIITAEDASIENLLMDIVIDDTTGEKLQTISLKNYFSNFKELSMYNITEDINSNNNVIYHSTVVNNMYKIRVIEPDSIEIADKYEAIPLMVTQKNKKVIGSVDLKEKNDTDKIDIKVINRYSGFYNPIFNDILYYDDYYEKGYTFPYSNIYIDYNYNDGYGKFGVIKNMYFHKTNTSRSDNILSLDKAIYPAINEYALDYRDYNIFSTTWDEGYFISQDDLENRSLCEGIGSMKESLCMFGSKYLNLPDYIFIDTFANGKLWDESISMGIRDTTDTEIMYKEINDVSVRYHLFIEKRLKRYLKEHLFKVFEKYIHKEYSFGNKGTIDDDIDEYVEKNLLKLYKVEKIHMYTKENRMHINDRLIENEYLKHIDESNLNKLLNGFTGSISASGEVKMKDKNFTMNKVNEFDRTITYNLKPGYKESFGFGISFRRK